MEKIITEFEFDANGWFDILLNKLNVGKRIRVETPTRKTFIRIASCNRVTIGDGKITDSQGGEIPPANASNRQTADDIFALRAKYGNGKDITAYIIKFVETK